jgi:hypothetical protein
MPLWPASEWVNVSRATVRHLNAGLKQSGNPAQTAYDTEGLKKSLSFSGWLLRREKVNSQG